jgi:uncharacterized membrane protein
MAASGVTGGRSSDGPVKKVTRSGERAVAKGIAKEASHVAGGLAKQAIKRTAKAAGRGARSVARRAGEAGADALAERARTLPIQRSVDVAVPVDVAWEQWLELRHIPEARSRVTDVERDGDTLYGRLDGVVDSDWEAEILDEREEESFAWHSIEGSDSAGLVTFHELGERLTRIELNLDVKPVHVIEAAALALHLADRRAEAELRRFKNDAELLDPDSYEELVATGGEGGQEDEEG